MSNRRAMHTILVIEVNQGILQNLIEILELEGFKALQACNGKLGVELFRNFIPDLIICDIILVRFLVIYIRAPINYQHSCIMSCRSNKINFSPFFKFNIKKIYRRISICSVFCSIKCSSNHIYQTGVMVQFHFPHLVDGNGLLMRWCGFIFLRQVHPKLHHFKMAASFRKFLFMIFFVQYACAPRHPLCISRINYATIACAVTRCTTLTL